MQRKFWQAVTICVANVSKEPFMNDKPRPPPFRFFTLRLWLEEAGEAGPILRGRVQDTASGEVRYFQGWEALVKLLQSVVEDHSPRHNN
jgi:hypothetical protein